MNGPNEHLFVMKCGGSTLAQLPQSFYSDLYDLQRQGQIPVIVHGGGPVINDMLRQLQISSTFVDGLRVTTDEVLDVVEMVLAGKINKEIVRNIQNAGAMAIGLSGGDAHLLQAEPVDPSGTIGFVGQVTRVNVALIQTLTTSGYMPVIAPIGIDDAGQRYNINADTAAGAVASHLGVERMIVVTDVPGILQTINGEKRTLASVTVQQIEQMILDGDIYGGMIPKVRAAMQCIQGNVREVVIVQGSEPRILSRVLSGETVGTRIIQEGGAYNE